MVNRWHRGETLTGRWKQSHQKEKPKTGQKKNKRKKITYVTTALWVLDDRHSHPEFLWSCEKILQELSLWDEEIQYLKHRSGRMKWNSIFKFKQETRNTEQWQYPCSMNKNKSTLTKTVTREKCANVSSKIVATFLSRHFFCDCRCVSPELKSLAVGTQSLVARALGEQQYFHFQVLFSVSLKC